MMEAILYPLSFIVLIIVLGMLRSFAYERLNFRRRMYMLFVYVSLLTVLTVVFFFVQPRVELPQQVVEETPNVYDTIYEQANPSLLAPYEKDRWTIPIEEETIRLQVMYTGQFVEAHVPVVLHEVETDQAKAEVVVYETPSTLNSIDISAYVAQPSIRGEPGRLIAEMPRHYYGMLEFRSIQHTAFLRQFQEEESEVPFFDMQVGGVVVVMTVPEGTTVMADVDQFDMIRK